MVVFKHVLTAVRARELRGSERPSYRKRGAETSASLNSPVTADPHRTTDTGNTDSSQIRYSAEGGAESLLPAGQETLTGGVSQHQAAVLFSLSMMSLIRLH